MFAIRLVAVVIPCDCRPPLGVIIAVQVQMLKVFAKLLLSKYGDKLPTNETRLCVFNIEFYNIRVLKSSLAGLFTNEL